MPRSKSKTENFDKLIVIVGPTASGKTNLAIELARRYDGEIICADSRTIYRHMDIGTAKPTVAEQQIVPHHLLDIIDPNEQFSVAQFKILCDMAITDIQKRKKVPFLVGGSGLYVDSVLFDYQFRGLGDKIDVSDMKYEQKIQKAMELYPSETIKIDVKNERRLDQLLMRGPADNSDRSILKKECKIFGLGHNKPELKQNIALRTKQMLNNKLIQETKKIISEFGPNCPGLRTVGYKQVVAMLGNDIAVDELEDAINRATLDLAKRQVTWFRRNRSIVWLKNSMQARGIADKYLTTEVIE